MREAHLLLLAILGSAGVGSSERTEQQSYEGSECVGKLLAAVGGSRGITDCGSRCLREEGCSLFSVPDGDGGTCSLSDARRPAPLAVKGGQCFRTPQAPEELKGIVRLGRAKNLCFPGSIEDYAVITNRGLYLFDKYDDIWNKGSCRGPEDLNLVFTGFPNLPKAENIDAAQDGNDLYVRLIAAGKLWQWEYDLQGNMKALSGFPKNMSTEYAGNIPIAPQWAAFRRSQHFEYHFYSRGQHYLRAEQQNASFRFYKFLRNETVISPLGDDMNFWYKLPEDTIAVMTVDLGINFLSISANWSVFTLRESPFPNYELVYKGSVVFFPW